MQEQHHSTLLFDCNKYNFYECMISYYKKKYPTLDTFENIHNILNTSDVSYENKKFYDTKVPEFGVNDRKSFLIRDFHHFIDNDSSFYNLYEEFIIDVIKPLFPCENKLVVQKTPNIRFHLPNCSNIGKRSSDKYDNVIGLHYDAEFFHPDNEINIVVPITDMYDTNSIYYEPYPASNINVYDYNNMVLSKNQLYMGNLNKCNHYNKINTTCNARVSMDLRIVPFSKFNSSNNNSSVTNKIKFDIGNYYALF
jgi:hypothetical protein